MALILNVGTRLCEADRFVRGGKWLKGKFPLRHTVRNRRLGILGFGNMGLEVARRGDVFGMEVAYSGRRKKSDVPRKFLAYAGRAGAMGRYIGDLLSWRRRDASHRQ
jgi:lactate dehydrogenase-like 2-hydroxyacid dehydrogenase